MFNVDLEPILVAKALVIGIPSLYVISFIHSCLFGSKHKRRYKKTRSKGLSALKRMSWQDFEHFCAEHFRANGYTVKMMGLGGADGGMDLVLKKRGKRTLVQCKHWKGRVGVTIVREMYGVMCADNFASVYIVALSGFTKEAHNWAKGKPIQLIGGLDML